MTLEVWERAAAHGDGSPEPRRGAARGRRSGPRGRLVWVVAALLAVGLVAAAVFVGVQRSAHRGVALDPDNAGGNGARALARVLDAHGTRVSIVRREGDLLDLPAPDAQTTVLVTQTDQLSTRTAGSLLEHARGARRIVLVEPSTFVLSALRLPVGEEGGGSPEAATEAACTLDGLSTSDTITPGGSAYSATSSDGVECFGFGGAAALVAVPAGAGRPEVVVLGDGDILSNSRATRLDNAGVAVRVLGRGDRLVWYVPSLLDVSDLDTTPTSELPRALGPLVFLGTLGLLVLMLWRGRRFGPLVVEPLPAVVKAVETTQSRGRLYRRARDTGRAADALRELTSRRLAAHLGLARSAGRAAVASAAATATGRDPERVAALLTGSPPTTEPSLLTLANDLSDLEKEVRRA